MATLSQKNKTMTARGFYIPVDLFIRATGLNDERNSKTAVRNVVEEHTFRKGYLWYHNALVLAKELQKAGKFYMYQDDVAVHILNLFDDMVASDLADVVYK